MKRWFFLCLAVLIVMTAACAMGEEVIHITDADGLLRMSEKPDGHYVLDQDIDLEGIAWQPIRFYGTLDGNGHSIRNLRVTAFDPITGRTMDGNGYKYHTNLMGFFSVAERASVRNISFVNADVRGEAEEHAFVGIVAAISTHSTFENVSVSGTACLNASGKMVGISGMVGYGTGSITDSDVDVTLVFVDTNPKKRCEQYMGGAVANGFMNCINVNVQIDGYASVTGFAHCGGLIGMHRQHEKRTNDNAITHVDNNTVSGMITFFEKCSERRAYCKGIIGERLNKYVKMNNNDDTCFVRNEIKKYDRILLPEGWE